MRAAARSLWDLLEEESRAAVRADTGRLLALQQEKGEAIERFVESGPTGEELDAIVSRIQENIALLRNLVGVLGGLVGQDGSSAYGASGKRVELPVGTARGRV